VDSSLLEQLEQGTLVEVMEAHLEVKTLLKVATTIKEVTLTLAHTINTVRTTKFVSMRIICVAHKQSKTLKRREATNNPPRTSALKVQFVCQMEATTNPQRIPLC